MRHAAFASPGEERCPSYAAGSRPVTDTELLHLAAALNADVQTFAFQSADTAMVLPRCRGRMLIMLNRRYPRQIRSFALRHELAHVLAGDVEDLIFLNEAGFMSREERAADLFALADAVPDPALEQWLRDSQLRSSLGEHIRSVMAGFTMDWAPDRIMDRTRLREDLFVR